MLRNPFLSQYLTPDASFGRQIDELGDHLVPNRRVGGPDLWRQSIELCLFGFDLEQGSDSRTAFP